MMRSMFAGVSGLKTHQAKMDVIGNNIANVNTVGFKGSSVTFQEVFSQTLQGAGSPQGGRGGTNPQQIGLGVNVAAMDVNHTQGSTQRTDNPTDVMVDGNGFFMVTDDANAQNVYYTRAGNFSLDKGGNLVTPGGLKVIGTTYDNSTTPPTVEQNKPVVIDKSTIRTATATDSVNVTGNLDPNEEVDPTSNIAYTITIDAYDSLGDVHSIQVNYGENLQGIPSATGGTAPSNYSYRAVEIQDVIYQAGPPEVNIDFGGLTIAGAGNAGTGTAAGDPVYAEFDSDGKFVRLVQNLTTDADGYVDSIGAALGDTDMEILVPGGDLITIPIYDSTTTPDTNLFENMTQYSGETDVTGVPNNGNSAGTIDSFSISTAGEVVAIFTNGERETLAQIGLAMFDNPAGLQKMGSNLFVDTPNSGTAKIGTPGAGSFGSLVPGALEMSNVDLSQQFTEMITTQRGFQANSRIITTSDEILQELVNLKR